MLISHKHKFLIINIPKTGTLSRKLALKNYCEIRGGQKHNFFYQHDTAIALKDKFTEKGWAWDDYFKYVTIRNPWARFASYYVWGKNLCEQNKNKTPQELHPLVAHSVGSFSKLAERCNNDPQRIIERIINIQLSQDKYFINQEDILVDYIAKLETIDYDFKFFCSKVGIGPQPALHNNNRNTSTPYNYKDLYNQELVDLVAEKEKYIIDKYGYQY